MSAATAPVTHAPPLLWAAARALIVTIFNLFGDPGAIAALHTHRKSERRLLLKWLRAGEALMRHLLLIEAAHCAKPNPQPLANKRLLNKRTRRLMSFEADKPEAWRVTFRCLSSQHRRSSSGGARGREKRFHSAWPLAERAEAMLRAFNHPEAYAKPPLRDAAPRRRPYPSSGKPAASDR